jgi:hypothetical protein
MVLNKINLDDWGIGSASDYCKLFLSTGNSPTDLSGNASTITATSMISSITKNGSIVLQTDNTNAHYITSVEGTADNYNISSGAFTISFWVKVNTERANGLFLSLNITDYTSGNSKLKIDSGAAATSLVITGGSASTQTVVSRSTNWTHYVLSASSATSILLYVNGVVNSSAFSVTSIADADRIVIGSFSAGNPTSASFKDVALFKGIALTSEQIRALYNATYIE